MARPEVVGLTSCARRPNGRDPKGGTSPPTGDNDVPSVPAKIARHAVAARLAKVRADSELTQEAFAVRLGFPKRTYLGWERGETEPPIGMLTALRREFDIDPDWILNGPESEPRPHRSLFDWARLQRLQDEIEHFTVEIGAKLTVSQLLALARNVFEADPATEALALAMTKRVIEILETPAR
ncbi:MAG: hypothetical protein B7Y99_02660 [Caulobacterales bacterium 32-69-10]|nr:MAG: hypothetical protein B7Y99_02660 [Caulobacterales bacterium 32-69-10]